MCKYGILQGDHTWKAGVVDSEYIFHKGIQTIKCNWLDCYDVFKNGLSGFAWSPITKMWSAEPEVWESLIQVCHLYSRSSYCFLWYILQAAA